VVRSELAGEPWESKEFPRLFTCPKRDLMEDSPAVNPQLIQRQMSWTKVVGAQKGTEFAGELPVSEVHDLTP